ncbi:MAG: rhomboid family intramembrane serine protease [Opitutales bacterium]
MRNLYERPELPPDFECPDGLEAVGAFSGTAEASEAGLAILAMGVAYWTFPSTDRYVLCVATSQADQVRRELREFAALRQAEGRKQLRSPDYREFGFGSLSFLLYAAILIACFAWQQTQLIDVAGRVDAVAMVSEGEWWRSVTALTLHGNVVHLASNLVAGVGFAFLVARFFGAATGWSLILLSGVAGNALNAWVHYPEPHLSVGASTAVFGGVGLLTGAGAWIALREGGRSRTLPRWFVPLFGGLTLLGLLGVGEGRVDVAAHISGFLCGLALGFCGAFGQRVLAFLQEWRVPVGALPLALLFFAWWQALR